MDTITFILSVRRDVDIVNDTLMHIISWFISLDLCYALTFFLYSIWSSKKPIIPVCSLMTGYTHLSKKIPELKKKNKGKQLLYDYKINDSLMISNQEFYDNFVIS